MQDTEVMTIGMWVDYIIEWNKLHEDKRPIDKKTGNKVEVHRATQADFDAF